MEALAWAAQAVASQVSAAEVLAYRKTVLLAPGLMGKLLNRNLTNTGVLVGESAEASVAASVEVSVASEQMIHTNPVIKRTIKESKAV